MSERDDPGTIGRRVQQLRTTRGLTQKQLAEPAYTPAYISTLEAGRVRASEDALRHIAERLGVAYDELATGRPARLATDLRLRLTEAQRTLAGGEAERAAEQYAALLDEAEAHDLTEEQAAALLGLGESAIDTGELADAREYFERAENVLADAPLPARVPALRGRAVSHYLAGELRYAVYLLESTLDELNRGGLHDPDALLLLYASIIGPYMDMGAHARAAQAAELALALAPRAGDPALVARMHRSVARTLLAEGRLVEHVDPLGGTTRFEYGPFGKITARTDPSGARYEFAYDTELNLVKVTNPAGAAWTYTYDDAGNLLAEHDFTGRTQTYTYDAIGQLAARTNGAGQVTEFLRSVTGEILERRTADGTFTTYASKIPNCAAR